MAQVWGIPGVSVCPLAIDDQGNFTPFPMVDGDKSQYFARKYVTITTGAKFAIEVRLHSYSSDANQEHLVDKMRVVCLLDGAEGINCTLESSDFISKAGENVLTKKFLSVQGQGCFLLVFKEINIGGSDQNESGPAVHAARLGKIHVVISWEKGHMECHDTPVRRPFAPYHQLAHPAVNIAAHPKNALEEAGVSHHIHLSHLPAPNHIAKVPHWSWSCSPYRWILDEVVGGPATFECHCADKETIDRILSSRAASATVPAAGAVNNNNGASASQPAPQTAHRPARQSAPQTSSAPIKSEEGTNTTVDNKVSANASSALDAGVGDGPSKKRKFQ